MVQVELGPAHENTQSMEFGSHTLPDLFHASPLQFLFFLERDGNQFLRFYWDEAGKKVGRFTPASGFGLNYTTRKPKPQTTVALISLPVPEVPGEAFFAALCFRPTRVTPFLRISDTTKVVTLEYCLDENQLSTTRMVEWSRRLEREVLGPGPSPQLEPFYQAVLTLLVD